MLQVWRAARRVRPPLRLKQARVPVTIERIFLQARVRYCLVCLHPEDPTLPVRCASESCPCHGQASGGLCSYDSEVDSYAYSRVAHHLKKQGSCEVRVMHTGVLLTPDSGHVILAAMNRCPTHPRFGTRQNLAAQVAETSKGCAWGSEKTCDAASTETIRWS